MVPVEGQLVLDIQKDQDTTSHADGQSRDVDEGITFVP
jgi:hypothetical protein